MLVCYIVGKSCKISDESSASCGRYVALKLRYKHCNIDGTLISNLFVAIISIYKRKYKSSQWEQFFTIFCKITNLLSLLTVWPTNLCTHSKWAIEAQFLNRELAYVLIFHLSVEIRHVNHVIAVPKHPVCWSLAYYQ